MLDQKILKELLNYNPSTGVFKWREHRQGVKANGIAGFDDGGGYGRIQLNGKTYKSHHLAWLWVYGEMPDYLDHVNHKKSDNRVINLREVDHSTNCKNRSKSKNNKSGVNGVSWYKTRSKWLAKITVNKKYIHLGYFSDKTKAAKARKAAERKFGFHKNHGLDFNKPVID